MDYFFYLYTSGKCLQFRKKVYLGNQFHYKNYNERDQNISKTFVFIFHHSIYHEAFGYTFCMEKKAFAREYFWFTPYT